MSTCARCGHNVPLEPTPMATNPSSLSLHVDEIRRQAYDLSQYKADEALAQALEVVNDFIPAALELLNAALAVIAEEKFA